MSFAGPYGPSDHLGDALSGLLDGELAAGREETATAHLAGCSRCAEELLAVRQARTWVRALPPVDAPFGFYERLLLDRQPVPGGPFGRVAQASPFARQSLARQSPEALRAQLRRRAGLVAVGAAAVAVTVLGVGSPRPSPVSPSVPQLIETHAGSSSVGADLLTKLAPVAVPVSFGR